MGRLFWKIFFAFWLTLVAAAVITGTLVALERRARESAPAEVAFGGPQRALTDLAAATLQHGGAEALRAWMDDVSERRRRLLLYAVDSSGEDLLGRPVPEALLERARELAGEPGPQAARLVRAPSGESYVVFVPSRQRGRPPGRLPPWMTLLIGAAASLAVAAVLAGYLTRPIRALRWAFGAVASGRLDTRVAPRIGADPESLAEAAKLLAHARRPLIVAGSSVAKSGAVEDLIKFAELLGAPVVMEPRYSFLSFPTDHPQSFQIAERQPSFTLPVWGEPDLLLAIGCRLIREYRYLPDPVIKPETRCIHIDEDPWEIGKVFPVEIGIIADAKSALRGLLEIYPRMAPGSNGREERLDCIRKAKEQTHSELETRVKQGWDGTPINTARLVRAMDRLIEKDALIVNESPTSKDILMANFKFAAGRSYFSNSSGGYLGWGLGAAIGAKLASPNRRVVACLGDGCTMFGLQGLWTLAKYRVPLTVIVFNNRAYMAVKNQFRGSEERVRIAAEMGAELTGPDLNFARLAETFGIFGQRIEQPDAIESALKRALEQNGPALVDVAIAQNTRKD